MTSRAESLLAAVGASTAFIEPNILAMPIDQLTLFRQTEPLLTPYSFYFDNLIRQKKHVLSPAEEALLSKISEVGDYPQTIFTMLARADIKFPEVKDEKGNLVLLVKGATQFVLSRTPIRKLFPEAIWHLRSYRNPLSATLARVIKTYFDAQARNSIHHCAAREFRNVPVSVYNNGFDPLTKRCRHSRYVGLKKKP